MTPLIAATAFLVASHVLPSAPVPRRLLIERLGRGGFLAAYSLLPLLALALVILAYRAAGPGPWLYLPPPEARLVALAGMVPAIVLLTARLTARAEARPTGIYRLAAAPGSLAVLLWALLHLLNLGEARQVVVFSGMAAIAAAALIKNLRLAPPAFREVGLLRPSALGRRAFWRELGVWRLGLALVAYAALLALHPAVIGRDPLAGIP
jgi:uncharacterized membrane protein